MKIIIYIQSNDGNLNPISMEALAAAQNIKKHNDAEIYAVSFCEDASKKLQITSLMEYCCTIVRS